MDIVLGVRLHRYVCLRDANLPVTVFSSFGWRSPTASGQLTMLPNEPWARQLWRGSPERAWLESTRYYNFDELAFGAHLHTSTRVRAVVDGGDDAP